MKIKIYGERNCGTNYLEKLIALNLKVDILKFQLNWFSILLLKYLKYDFIQDLLFHFQGKTTLGWKHGCPPVQAIKNYNTDLLVIVTLTKNPYSFLSSLYKKLHHMKGKKSTNFSDFISRKWTTRRRDLCKEKQLDTPI